MKDFELLSNVRWCPYDGDPITKFFDKHFLLHFKDVLSLRKALTAHNNYAQYIFVKQCYFRNFTENKLIETSLY